MAPDAAASERVADRLYGLPLDEFVRERDALTRSLREEGRREEADAVRALQKPTVVAGLVNRLARERPDDVRRLLDAAGSLREAQVSGKGDFASAAAAEREAVGVLVRAARELGEGASESTLDRVARTLQAAAGDDATRGLLERGVLTREVEPTGFGSLLGALPPAPARAKRPESKPNERERKRAEREVASARAGAEKLSRAADAAERAAAEARRRAEEAAAELSAAERRLAAISKA